MNDVADLSALDVTESASPAFPKGTFKPLVTFQMMILCDLIEMGYDVVMMDIDIIFNRDPLPYIQTMKNELFPIVDIWTMIGLVWSIIYIFDESAYQWMTHHILTFKQLRDSIHWALRIRD